MKIRLGLLMGKFCLFLTELSARDMSGFHFRTITSKCQWIFTKLAICLDTVEIYFGIAIAQILSIFDSYLPAVNSGGVLLFYVFISS